MTMFKSGRMFFGALVLAVASGCGGGSGVVTEAQDRSDSACACETFDCTMEHMAWFNEQSVINSDELDGLSTADREAYDTARRATGDCQDALR